MTWHLINSSVEGNKTARLSLPAPQKSDRFLATGFILDYKSPMSHISYVFPKTNNPTYFPAFAFFIYILPSDFLKLIVREAS